MTARQCPTANRLEVDAYAGEDAREFLDVFLRVSGADTHRVQLHDLACVILVYMADRVLIVVEVAQHRGMPEGGLELIPESSERMQANRLIFVISAHGAEIALAGLDVAMVETRTKSSCSRSWSGE